jgi:all-trans-retinol dehydrogenase (NAD+)
MAAAATSSIIASAIGLIKRAAFEPTLTGPLLLILTRGPEKLRQPLQRLILRLFASNRSLAYVVKTLKWLFALGLAARVNDILTAWAMNHWRLRKQGVPWDFDSRTKKEIAVVTGGCSGFGYLTVKGLAGKMKVVILDVSDLPEDLKSCMSAFSLYYVTDGWTLAD